MQLSKYNVVSKIKDANDYFVINALSGNADILDEVTYLDLMSGNSQDIRFAEKGYMVDPEEEKRRFHKEYLTFLDEREKDELQLFFVTNYSCNFNCPYCYQAGYQPGKGVINNEITDAFFSHVEQNFSGRRKYLTVFGGEPLLPGKNHKENIQYLLEKATAKNLDVAIVTNGYHISEYMEVFSRARIREVQVTLDGTEELHNQRRPLKNGRGTFAQIVEGINKLVAVGIPVNLRMVVDRDNISNLPALAQFAIDRGWTQAPEFKTQLGRNYELHECQDNGSKLYSRLELYNDLYALIQEHPHITEFHKPAFSVSRFLFENGELPPPLFDACTGTKTEWAYDYTGKIYACTATVGKKGEELGTFFPEAKWKDEEVEEWKDRDILSIPQCRDCAQSLICGGGCASMARNYNGNLNSHDCRPVKELMELGIASYLKNEEA